MESKHSRLVLIVLYITLLVIGAKGESTPERISLYSIVGNSERLASKELVTTGWLLLNERMAGGALLFLSKDDLNSMNVYNAVTLELMAPQVMQYKKFNEKLVLVRGTLKNKVSDSMNIGPVFSKVRIENEYTVAEQYKSYIRK